MSKAIKTETNGKVEAEVKEVDEVSIEETDVEDVAAAEPAEAASAPPAEEPFSAPYSDEAASAPPPDEAPTHSEAEKVNPAPSEEKAPTHPEVEEVNPTSLAKDAPAIAEVALHEASAILETETVESVTAAAVEAAVAAAAQVRATVVLNDPTMPNDRDVILGEGSAGHKTNLLLQDIIRLHRILWKMHDKPPPTSAHQIQAMAQHIINIIQNGKQLEIAGLKDVPKPFMRSTGRFFGKDAETNEWKMLDDAAIKTIMTEIILDEFKVDDLGPITDTPYKDLKEWITKKTNAAPNEFLPEAKDAILLPVYIESMDKMYEQQQGNKTLFHLASQLVTSYTNSPDKRVEAALSIMKGLDETLESMESAAMSDHPTTTKTTRFLIRKQRDDRSVAWDIMDPASAAEFTLIFVFEVFLEKEIHILTGSVGDASLGFYSGLLAGSDGLDTDTSKPSTVPIVEPTDHDVLFGRGGMTNSFPGNRRFRDVIALHRPDYIRAIKMDKPGVARKIVKAIRMGNPPGRFLKKGDDGMYYDVGDRTASEKTSQGLRERTNAEKRQRSALREALRIRKQDMLDDLAGLPADKKASVGEGDASSSAAPPILNYVGTNLPVPLSLSMKDTSVKVPVARKKNTSKDGKGLYDDINNTEGLPPNAVDDEGNILVTDYDILCGRGGLTNHHKGNKRFRDVVQLHRPDYVRAPKIQKPSVARVIVRAIRNGDPPGRFLRKDEKTGKWVDIGDKKAAEKTSQALREKTSEERETTKEISGGMLFPSPDSYLEPFLGSLRAATLLAVEAGSLMTVEAAASAASEAATPSAGAGEGKDNSEEGKVPPDEKAGDAAESSKGTNTFDTEMV